MPTVFEASVGISSFTGAIFTSVITGSLIDLTIVPTLMADDQVIESIDNSNTTKLPVSEEERQRYLDQLQSKTTSTMIPALVFLSILVVAGLVGNSLVIFVYSCKLQWSATRILIITLAMLDLVANIVAIPGEMYDMFHIWDFDNPALCRARLYCSTFSTVSAAMILLAVAVTRYRKVCHPHKWQITTRAAKVISVVLATLGVVFSIPYAILNGRQTKKTPRTDIYAYECTTDDEYVNTSYPLANYAFFLVMYISCSVSLTVLYILIGAKAWKHSKIHGASPGIPIPAMEEATSSKYTSKVMESSSEQNCTSCGNPNNKSLDASITVESSGRITSCGGGDIKINQFHVDEETSQSAIPYNVRVFTDRIEVQTTMVGEFFVKLQQTKPGLLKLPSYVDSWDSSIIGDVANLQVTNCYEEKASNIGIKMIDRNDSNEEMMIDSNDSNKEMIDSNDSYKEMIDSNDSNEEMIHINDSNEEMIDINDSHEEMIDSNDSNEEMITVNSILCDIDSNGRWDESCTDEFPNHEDKQVAARRDDKINEQLNIFHSTLGLGNYDQEYNDHIPNPGIEVDNEKQHPVSEQTAVNEVPYESDPLSVYKWLDVVYCPDNGHSSFCPRCVQRDTSLSFRLSLNNNLLQKTQWLRTSVFEALRRHDEPAKGKSFISLSESCPAGNHTHSSIDSPMAHQDNRVTESIRPQHNTSLPRNRLREILTQKLSSLKIGSQRHKVRRRPIGRTTVMLIIISVIYILGYLPHLTLMLAKFLSPDMLVNMSMVELTFYNLFLRTYFLNCAVNPIVYSLCDSNFRRACFKVIKCS